MLILIFSFKYIVIYVLIIFFRRFGMDYNEFEFGEYYELIFIIFKM